MFLKPLSPIVLFVYNRPEHVRRTVEALQKNRLACDSELIIYSDGSSNHESILKIANVREYLKAITGFRKIQIRESLTNKGLSNSIIDGVTSVLFEYGKVIVLEDDMVTSPYFLTYMNEALEKYASDDRVVSIHGYVYPVKQPLPEAFFLHGADCWGWATWSRGWSAFNSNGQFILDELKRRKLIHAFDFNGAYPYSKMLEGQITGANDSWAVRWYGSAYLAGKLTLYPGRSLVHNIGNDDSGTHCGETDFHNVELSNIPIDISRVKVRPSQKARTAIEAFFRKNKAGVFPQLLRKARALFWLCRR